MPQLMPFFWKNSVFMIFMLLSVLVFFYFFKKMEKMSIDNFKTDIVLFKFVW